MRFYISRTSQISEAEPPCSEARPAPTLAYYAEAAPRWYVDVPDLDALMELVGRHGGGFAGGLILRPATFDFPELEIYDVPRERRSILLATSSVLAPVSPSANQTTATPGGPTDPPNDPQPSARRSERGGLLTEEPEPAA